MSASLLPATPPREIYSVARLNREARALLSTSFPLLWVQGELSNLSRPASGHLYFTLKDGAAQVRCAMFRSRNLGLRFAPAAGMEVVMRARVGLYEPRGEFQLTVEHMEEAGDGALQRAFEALKQRLGAEGLFDEARKKPLPLVPRQLGIVTSPTGAALRDILSVLGKRAPALPVVIYPVPVQGAMAAPAIARALMLAARRADCDVLIVSRGGGSLEDLWPFNEEAVARALAACPLPVVSGVGHETDFTIADLAADARAPTPSAAAALASPDQSAWLTRLARFERQLTRELDRRLREPARRLAWLRVRLEQRHPARHLQQQAQRLDELEQRLNRGLRFGLGGRQSRLSDVAARLQQRSPQARVAATHARHTHLAHRLYAGMRQRLETAAGRVDRLGRTLHAVSPLATLGRGYALATRADDGALLRHAREVSPGEAIRVRLCEGGLEADVTAVHAIEPPVGPPVDNPSE